MNQYLLLLFKLQSILSDELKWLYFNKLFLLPRQNFWCWHKQIRGEGQELFPILSLNQIVLESPLCRSSQSICIYICISVLAWVSLPAPRQIHFVFKAILEAEMSHLMTDMVKLSLLLLLLVSCASWELRQALTMDCFPSVPCVSCRVQSCVGGDPHLHHPHARDRPGALPCVGPRPHWERLCGAENCGLQQPRAW